MRAIGSMGHTVMVSSLLLSYLSLIQMSTLNRLELQFTSVLSAVFTVCLLIRILRVNCMYQVLSPWNAPTPLLRSWCLWELYCKGLAFCAILYISLTLPLLSLAGTSVAFCALFARAAAQR